MFPARQPCCKIESLATNLTHSRVALPLDLRYLSRNDIDIKRSISADSFLPLFLCNGVMTGHERNPKAALIIGRELGNRTGFVADYERCIRQRF